MKKAKVTRRQQMIRYIKKAGLEYRVTMTNAAIAILFEEAKKKNAKLRTQARYSSRYDDVEVPLWRIDEHREAMIKGFKRTLKNERAWASRKEIYGASGNSAQKA